MYTWNYIKNATLSKLDLNEDEGNALSLISRFKYYANEAMTMICSTIKPKRCFATFTIGENDIGKIATINDSNFISFGDDVNWLTTVNSFGETVKSETSDSDFLYSGYKDIIPFKTGTYLISYNARWCRFDNIEGSNIIDAPIDIVECLPSYIASQCMKVDDEYKASVFRNEFEIMFARIDDTHYKTNKTFKIGGDW